MPGMARAPVVPLVESRSGNIWRVRMLGDYVNGFLVRDPDGQVTLIDVGLRRSAPRVLEALGAVGSAPSQVTQIVLTHAHADHAGAAAALSDRTGRDVDVHRADAAYIRAGEAAPVSGVARLLPRRVFSFAAATVGEELVDGQLLDVAGGLRVVHTPGHSPGHISLVHEDSRLLITGDALFNMRGVGWPGKYFCTDFRLTQHTAHVLGELDYDLAAFTHGPELRERPRETIRAFLRRHPSTAVGGGT